MYDRNKIFYYILQYGLKTLPKKKKRKKRSSIFLFLYFTEDLHTREQNL